MSEELPPVPFCPICGEPMQEAHRRYQPRMNQLSTIYAYRWACAKSDEKGNGHYVEITKRTP